MHTIENHTGAAMQARLLLHEAHLAGQGNARSLASALRLALLTEAHAEACAAADRAPGCLSCAALRATLAINLLVERSMAKQGQQGTSRLMHEKLEQGLGSTQGLAEPVEHSYY